MNITFDDLEILRPYKRENARISRRDWYRLLGKISEAENEKGCLLWIAAQTKGGYGVLTINDKQVRATRFIYEVFYNCEVPADKEVCHDCDTPACINPAHLWLGTSKENAQDKMRKGRWKGGVKKGYYAGEANQKAKLKHADVAFIRDQKSTDRKVSGALAKKYGVTQSAIYAIWNNKSWVKNVA